VSLNQHTADIMKTLIALYLGFVSLVALADLPQNEPDSAYFITSCNEIVMVLIRMPDGTDIVFDRNSQESADAVKQFASQSKKPARVYEVGCYKFEDRTSV
jgi:hypothetical protein